VRLGQRRRLGVHEQRARERLVGAVLDGILGRLDAAAARVDAHQVQLVLVALEVGEAEVAEPAGVAGDALDELVVVLGGLVVLARDVLFTVDLGGEEVERTRVRAGTVERQLGVGQAALDLGEVLDLGALVPQLLELVGGQAVDLEVLVGDDGDPVVGDLDLAVFDAGLLAGGRLLVVVVLDRTRGVADVGLAGAELLEAAAGPGLADRHLDVGLLLGEELGRGLGEREDRRRAVDADVAGELLFRAASAAASAAAASVVIAAACGNTDREQCCRPDGQQSVRAHKCSSGWFLSGAAGSQRTVPHPVTESCSRCENDVKARARSDSRSPRAYG
jgi:hypothetical protein